eukprot:gene6077-6316_t
MQVIPQQHLSSSCSRSQKVAQRDRAALLRHTLHRPDPLLLHITERVLDRLEDCLAKFPTAVVLGGAGDLVAEGLTNGRAGVEKIIHIDSSPGMLALAKVTATLNAKSCSHTLGAVQCSASQQ